MKAAANESVDLSKIHKHVCESKPGLFTAVNKLTPAPGFSGDSLAEMKARYDLYLSMAREK